MMSPIELLKCCYQFGFLIPLAQQLCNEHFTTQKYEKCQIFLSEKCHFLVVKFSVYLNRRIFVMVNEAENIEVQEQPYKALSLV